MAEESKNVMNELSDNKLHRIKSKTAENLEATFKKMMSFSDECFGIIAPHVSYRQFKKNTLLIRPGDVNTNIYVVLKGMGASYCVTRNGDCRYIYLPLPSYVVAEIHTLHDGRPARNFFEIMKGSAIAIIDGNILKKLAAGNPSLAEWYMNILTRGLSNVCGRLEEMISSDAKERLMHLLENNPELFSKAMKKHLAGFIGIDQSTLSRLLSAKVKERNCR